MNSDITSPEQLSGKYEQEISRLKERISMLEAAGNRLRKYEFIGNASGDLMTLISREYVYEAVNHTYLREHNLKREAVEGKSVAEVWGEDSFELSIKHYLDACFSGRKIQYQAWFTFHDQPEGCYDVTYYPYSESGGEITHAAVITHNITALKETEIALRESEERFRGIAEGSFDMIFILDKSGNFTYISPASRRIAGFTPEQMTGGNFRDYFRDFESSTVKDTFLQMIKGEKIEGRQLLMNTTSGEDALVEINGLAMSSDTSGQSYQGIVRDITLRKKMEIRQRELELQLIKEHKLSSIGILASGLTHNINNPLTAIFGAGEIIRMKYPRVSEVSMIMQGADRIKNIVNNLMTKSRKEQQISREPIDLAELLKTELEFLNADPVFKHEITKEYHFAENLPKIQGVYSDFSQGLLNIIRNSVDAMYGRETRILTVSSGFENEAVIIRIADTGCGIPAVNIPKLFDPFFTTKPTMNNTETKGPKGTGLGLYSTHQLLSPYGASIRVESKPEAGTEFIITIPVS